MNGEPESKDWKLIDLLYPDWQTLENKKILVVHSFECAYLLAFKNEVTYLSDDPEMIKRFEDEVINNFAFGFNDDCILVKDWQKFDYENLQNVDDTPEETSWLDVLKDDEEVDFDEIYKEIEDSKVEEKTKKKNIYYLEDAGVKNGDQLIFYGEHDSEFRRYGYNAFHLVKVLNAGKKELLQIEGKEYKSSGAFAAEKYPKANVNARNCLFTMEEFAKGDNKKSIAQIMREKFEDSKVEEAQIEKKRTRVTYTYADAGVENGQMLIVYAGRDKMFRDKNVSALHSAKMIDNILGLIEIDGKEYSSIGAFMNEKYSDVLNGRTTNSRCYLFTLDEWAKGDNRKSIAQIMNERNHSEQ